MPKTKSIARLVHLWTGLVFGTLLVMQGLTGSVLSWHHELDSMLNPGLLQVAPHAGMARGAPLRVAPATVQAVRDLLAGDPGHGQPAMLALPERAGEVFVAWYRPAPGGSPWRQGITRQVMVDPATLTITGGRNWGEAGFSRPLLVPTLFHLHRYLMAGELGKVVVALQGIALALAALSGLVLWWPRLTRSALWSALTVRHGGSWPRLSFQLHRAAGFFAAPVFLLAGLSGTHFNMPGWTTPVVNAVAPVTPTGKMVNRSGPGQAAIPVATAMEAAQARMPSARVSRIGFPAKAGQPYEIRVRQPGELRHGDGATRISVDSGDGRVLRVLDPLVARGGDALLSSLYPLHTGEAFGPAGRGLVTLAGLLPLGFFVTGLTVWLRRRKPARTGRRKPLAA